MKRQPEARDEQHRDERADREWHPPPDAQTDDDRHEDRRQGRAQAEQRIEREDGSIDLARKERSSEVVEHRHQEAEADPEKRGCSEQRDERRRVVAHHEARAQEERHRREVGGEPDEVDPLFTPATCEPTAKQRCRDRHQGLRNEQEAVLSAREAVVLRAREDRARRGKGHERYALQESRGIDADDLAAPWHRQPRRCSRWSPTRSALAIAVSAGLTAPMLGKKLVSTT